MADIIIPKYGSADKEEFHRPDHPDFMTSQELAKKEWSGVRCNSITRDQEIWVRGECKAKVSEMDMKLNPSIWTRTYAAVFGLKNVEFDEKKGN